MDVVAERQSLLFVVEDDVAEQTAPVLISPDIAVARLLEIGLESRETLAGLEQFTVVVGCRGRAEIADAGVGEAVVDDDGRIGFCSVVRGRLTVVREDGLQTLESSTALRAVTPSVGDAGDVGKVAYLLFGESRWIVGTSCIRQDEDVDAHLSLRLATVTDEVSDAALLVGRIHVVVGFGVEGHADVLRS